MKQAACTGFQTQSESSKYLRRCVFEHLQSGQTWIASSQRVNTINLQFLLLDLDITSSCAKPSS